MYLIFTCEQKLKNRCGYPNFGVKKMSSHQNHSCVTKILNANNLTSIHAIGMCNASSESSHSGDFSLKISSLLILNKCSTKFLHEISMQIYFILFSPTCATFLAELYTTITCQLTKLESYSCYSNRLKKIHEVLQSVFLLNLEKFGFWTFWVTS